MSIAGRILLGFGAGIIALVVIGVVSLEEVGVVRTSTQTIVNRDLKAYRALYEVSESQATSSEMRRAVALGFLAHGGSAPDLQTAIGNWDQQMTLTSETLGRAILMLRGYESSSISPARRTAWGNVATILESMRGTLTAIHDTATTQLQAVGRADMATVMATEPKLGQLRQTFVAANRAAEDGLEQGVAAGQDRIEEIYEASRDILVTATVLAILICIAMTIVIGRSIARPLGRFVVFAEGIERGDLTIPPVRAGRNELGRLGAALNAMVEALRQAAVQSRDVTRSLDAAAAEIRASTQQQAASVEQQLAAIQETAATADQITHSGTRIAQRAEEVIQAAQATMQSSAGGLRAVEETARAITLIRDQGEMVASNVVSLSEKTQAVGEIITTVNEIAERSHLLALNAAIEAAAAGDRGRSFAVVAVEMKVLADQAKEATVQVRSILGEIQRGINTSVMLTEEAVKRVAAGKERTDIAERTIEEITGSVRESVQTFQQIVASTNQQQIGVEQVMSALQNIRQASQQTAAGTRQLDSAAGHLTELSRQLVGLADRYRI